MFLVEQIYKNGISRLIVFGRKNGKKTIKLVSDFRPYFYVKEDCLLEDESIIKIEKGFKTIDGFNVKKVFVKSAKDVIILRNGRDTWESDFQFNSRYIVDTYKKQEEDELKIFNFDIETDSDDKFPDIQKANQAITSIAVKCNDKIVFVWREDLKDKCLNNNPNIRTFDNEVEMLKGFLDYLQDEDPDILFGFNIKHFDLPYIINRCNVLNIDYVKLSHQSIKKVFINKNGNVVIGGRIVLDLFELLNHPFIKESEWADISLDGFSKEILGEEKIKHKETFHNMWRNNLDKFIKYNMRDVELVDKINKKKKIIQFFDIVRRITNCSFDDFRPISVGSKTFYGTSKVLDCFMFTEFPEIIFPNRRKPKDNDITFKGSSVLEPIPGIYDKILCLDLEALYTNIMRSGNISFETLDTNGEIDINGIRFTKKEGFMPKLLFKIQEKRKYYKKLMKLSKTKEESDLNDQRQRAIKILGNALWGYIGHKTSRFYRREIASSITFIGRELISYTIEKLRDLGYRVVGSDTDSTYIIGKSIKTSDLLKEGIKIRNILNDSYNEFAKRFNIDKHYFNIELEKIIEKIIFLPKKLGKGGAKKRYAYKLLWSEKKFDPKKLYITGIEAIKSSESIVSKNLQSTVLDMILDDKSEVEVKSFIKKIEENIRKKVYKVEEIGFPRFIGKELNDYDIKRPVVEGSLYANKFLGKNYGKGSKPHILKIKQVIGYPHTDYLSFDDEIPDGFKIDYNDVIRKTIRDKVETIFKAMKWDWEDLCVGNKSLKGWI